MTTLFPATTCKADVTVGASHADGLIWIPGGTFRMGSDKHYPEEAPVHRVTVDPFWIDRKPVTNREFGRALDALQEAVASEDGVAGLQAAVGAPRIA